MNDEEMNERKVFVSKSSSIPYLTMTYYQIPRFYFDIVHLDADHAYRIIFTEHVHIESRPAHGCCQIQFPQITQPQLHLTTYLLQGNRARSDCKLRLEWWYPDSLPLGPNLPRVLQSPRLPLLI